jgi:transposase-like protein
VEELLPLLYLKGISTGDFSEALSALLGPDAVGLSAKTISRLKGKWVQDYEKWRLRDLSHRRYVYVWADGVYANVRLDDARLCLLVLIGARADGKKELIAVEDGYRESEQSWWELLRDLRSRGLSLGPKLAIGDGALGFWKALAKIYGNSRQQRCWMHKTGNVLNYLPKAVQPKAKKGLHQIWMADTRENAYQAFDEFIETYQLKFPKATSCLAKDRTELLAFYDYPAEHWPHLRTTNPIESTFATVKLRTAKTRGCLSRQTMLTMVFKLCLSAEKRWRRLQGYRRLGEVIENVKFVNGIRENEVAA